MSLYDRLRRLISGGNSVSPVISPGTDSRRSEEDLCADGEAILKAAVAGVDPRECVARALAGRVRTGARDGNVWVVGFGKAAVAMASGARDALGNGVAGGILVVPAGSEKSAPPGFEVFGAGHPVPDQGGVAGSRAIRALAREARDSDELIVLVSGGGSAMLTLPPDGVPLEAIQQVTVALLKAGATIGDLNCVRRHLDELKGGRLAALAHPAAVFGLVLSDVVGDPLDVVASGPVTPDSTRSPDAIAVLERYGLWDSAPAALREHLRRQVASDRSFDHVRTVIVGNSLLAANAAVAEAKRLGYATELLTATLTGEAREAGIFLAESARALAARPDATRPACLVAAGETVVTVRGGGRGGRNQEVALGAIRPVAGVESVLIASLGTDGIDGPTDAAGAFVTGSTLARAEKAGLDLDLALATNDAYPFFEALGDLIVSGPTGTNVADVQIVLIG